MTIDFQDEIIALLGAEAGVAPAEATTIGTHISLVLLLGRRVYKLKRPVRLPYLDFSTPQLRLAACERELRLNRRTAPMLYRGVRRITRESDGRLALDGPGALVEAAVEMARFDADGLFEAMAGEGRLTPALMTALAGQIAAFHGAAEIDVSGAGARAMASVLDINARGLALTDLFATAEVAALNGACRAALARHGALLDARGRAGKIRHCHGDLHLRNICLIDGVPTLFDGLEFDEALATTDVLYDLAFVLMDLWHRGLDSLANTLFNRYLDATGDEAGLPLLPFFMAVRATVRAHVVALQAQEDKAAGAPSAASEAEAGSYLGLALACLAPREARLVAVGGLSGSGKSTVAAAVAPAIGPVPGARILASDRLRKRRFGVAAETRLPSEAYRPEVSAAVYAELMAGAAAILRLGHGVVADAVFDRAPDREQIAAVGAAAGAAFQGLWLEAGIETLVSRVDARTGDASDATPDVVRAQALHRPEGVAWAQIAAEGGREAVCQEARRHLGLPASSQGR
ncbi:bifunctional aminoglycoside phosphotransferase/ATP-binding protein [Bosea sp. (in: a-proteobacteria)]|uniref:bifunctional aminoglycoside phosphotransferase/ATP-binding protein n=1 Tax=Bosea sp. (in: a-proteobacteria) TaxID=1871050 RepID=UPI002733AB91|nr:bifunctional aminoglycoside phosphotransferase/ATP-binding protein [Bosea sp. (in: a-proteobacteria)]MDP3410456.1 AAA family ATPase [Bosea sp. (in: a-proteobacteria)]